MSLVTQKSTMVLLDTVEYQTYRIRCIKCGEDEEVRVDADEEGVYDSNAEHLEWDGFHECR